MLSTSDTARMQGARESEPAPAWPGRVAIESVTPQVDDGRWPVKRVVGDEVVVEADVFSDGHDIIDCDLLWRFHEWDAWRRAPMRLQGNDRWRGMFAPQACGRHEFTIEAWRDPFASWVSDVTKKIAAVQNVEVEVIEGMRLIDRARERAPALQSHWRAIIDPQNADAERLALLLSPDLIELMREYGPRSGISQYEPIPLSVDRPRAAFSAWYELFPRSASKDAQRHGAFDDVIARLPYVRDLGFDVLYFTPIHPIGRTNRKGRNNSLAAGPDDPGSVYAIGAQEGGHDSIHPQLGTLAEFDQLVREATAHGLEIALDIAWQCSPDHPWLKQHPDWFEHRPDGSIKYAENPPKKYEDIVNIRFDGPTYRDVWRALRDVVLFWASHGVRIFRMDNPHTKPLPFWEWMIGEVLERHSDCIFLSEAFTRPKMMKRLAKIGFQQSYTYFTWRNTKQEIIDYVNELSGDMADYYRPNFFVNTPDINPFYLQTSGRAGFIVRSTLAATLSCNWGMYSGFEICEAAAPPGREEYLDSEKYEIRARDFDAPGNIKGHIRRLNAIRNAHPALQVMRNVLFLNAWNDNIIAYARIAPERDEIIMALVNLDPHERQECAYEVPLWEFGLPDSASIEADDLLFGGRFTLYGKTHQIALDPSHNPAIVWRLIAPTRGRPS
ncbi:MAG: alpha-1,4-glucan--maltose-1-phosphate maltosyltransferase [Beijerinckiaceae bacterium]|nr:alpha-1,4-glucan--maltose-1-phosphate maltosyltransferase [Beijerinckiaceae bacterium]